MIKIIRKLIQLKCLTTTELFSFEFISSRAHKNCQNLLLTGNGLLNIIDTLKI